MKRSFRLNLWAKLWPPNNTKQASIFETVSKCGKSNKDYKGRSRIVKAALMCFEAKYLTNYGILVK